MEPIIKTLTPQAAAERLRAAGMRITPDTIRYGLQQGTFPFGDHIQRDGGPVYFVYEELLEKWITERASKCPA